MSDATKPWDRLPKESSKAYSAFVAYLQLGPKRSIAKTLEDGDGTGKRRWLEKWSSKYDWVRRARAHDTAELQASLQSREEARERARQVFVDEFPELAQVLVAIASGKKAQMTQVVALRAALALGGLVEPKKVELSGGADPLKLSIVDEALEVFSDDELDGIIGEEE